MLKQNEVEITINHGNFKHYEELGYPIRKEKDKKGRPTTPEQKLVVKIEDIPKGSRVKIPLICDFCGCEFEQRYVDYIRRHEHYDRDYDYCSGRECRNEAIRLTKIKKYGTTSTAEIAKITGGPIGRLPKYSKKDLIEMAELKNYTINTEFGEHIIMRDRISLTCNIHGNVFETSVECFMNENVHNCPKCNAEYMSEIQREATIEEAAQICKEKNYTLLTDFIRNVDDPIYYICNVHPEYGEQKTSLYGLRRYEHNCKMCHQPRGENHHNWQGGISGDRERDNDSVEYKRWRRSVFKRDNFTCQCCGSKHGKLNAHHIKNYSSNTDLRYDKDNGITLCEECHLNNYPDAFHKIYGNYNNTPEQLQSYLNTRRKELGLPSITIEEIINN